jgi:hypothetical protein
MTTDRFITVAGMDQSFRRTRRNDGEDGCGLPVYELVSGLAPISYGSPVSLFPVHLRGGNHDGAHVWVGRNDRSLIVASDGARYRQTFRRERRHGCGLPIFKIQNAHRVALASRLTGRNRREMPLPWRNR